MTTQATSTGTGGLTPLSRGECRIYERHPCDLETSCQPPTIWGGQDVHWPAHIRDVSQGGLGLVLRRRFEKGTGLAVELPGPTPDDPTTMLVRVVRVAAQPDGAWLLGCSFISDLSEEEVRALTGSADPQELAPPAAETVIESVPREPSRLLVTGVHLEGVLPSGQVVRRWMDRLYPGECWPVVAGSLFVLRTNRGPAGKVGLRLRVDRCTRRGAHWVLRGAILHADAAQVASALGL